MTGGNKKQPVRMCIACRCGKPKRELIRIVRTKEGALSIDKTGKAPGRGAYVCADQACIEKAKKIFPKILHCEMDGDLYEMLIEIVSGYGK